MKPLLLFSALAGLTMSAVGATPALAGPAAQQASIPFVDSGSIRDYRADGTDALYVQGTNGKWYRAELIGTCIDLPYAETIGFDARGTNSFDRFSSIIVRGHQCHLTSLVESGPPPKKAKKKG